MLTAKELIEKLKEINIKTFIRKTYRRIGKDTGSRLNKFYEITINEGSSDESEGIRLSIKLAFDEKDENARTYIHLYNKIIEKLQKKIGEKNVIIDVETATFSILLTDDIDINRILSRVMRFLNNITQQLNERLGYTTVEPNVCQPVEQTAFPEVTSEDEDFYKELAHGAGKHVNSIEERINNAKAIYPFAAAKNKSRISYIGSFWFNPKNPMLLLGTLGGAVNSILNLYDLASTLLRRVFGAGTLALLLINATIGNGEKHAALIDLSKEVEGLAGENDIAFNNNLIYYSWSLNATYFINVITIVSQILLTVTSTILYVAELAGQIREEDADSNTLASYLNIFATVSFILSGIASFALTFLFSIKEKRLNQLGEHLSEFEAVSNLVNATINSSEAKALQQKIEELLTSIEHTKDPQLIAIRVEFSKLRSKLKKIIENHEDIAYDSSDEEENERDENSMPESTRQKKCILF